MAIFNTDLAEPIQSYSGSTPTVTWTEVIEMHSIHNGRHPSLPRLIFTMRGDWDLIPEGRAEWIGYGIALIVVILAALWINR
jgi:hypothetical protein